MLIAFGDGAATLAEEYSVRDEHAEIATNVAEIITYVIAR